MTDDFYYRLEQKKREDARRGYALLGGLFILLAVLGVYAVCQVESIQKEYIYPYPYREYVEQYAALYDVDSSLVASVILNESKFQNDVHSHSGAVGLMQLMPETADWVAKQVGDKSFSADQLHDPQMNIRYGTWYLASLEKEFAGNEVLVLAAYNAGRGNVHEWMQQNNWPADFHEVSAIPYEETRAYVWNVLKNQKKYQHLYYGND